MQTFRPFNALTPGEQASAIAALDAAGDQAAAAGADPGRVRDVQRRHTADLALDATGAAVLLVEVPLRRDDPRKQANFGWRSLPSWSAAMAAVGSGTGAVGGPRSEDAAVLVFISQSERRPMPLLDAVKLLTSDDSPVRFLDEQRARLEQLRTDWRRELEAKADAAKRAAEENARWQRENADRVAAWDRLPRPAQLLHAVADQHPEHAPLLTAVADAVVKHADPHYGIGMPASFRQDLARLSQTTRASGAPSTAPGAVTTESAGS